MADPVRAPRHWFDEHPQLVPRQFDNSPCDKRWDGCGTVDVYLAPDKFLALTSTTETSPAITPALVREYAAAMEKGDRFPILMLKLSLKNGEWKITGHEGRHRSIAASRVGLKAVPVTLDIEGPPERVEEAVDKLRGGLELHVRAQEYRRSDRGALMWLTPLAPDGQTLLKYIAAAEAIRARRGPVERLPVSLRAQLDALRPQLAAVAQRVYDQWDPDDEDNEFGGGGICDVVAREMEGVIGSEIDDVEIEDGGHDGDDHAWLLVSRGGTTYAVDIPPGVYEVGGGYSWRKLPDVTITPDDVVIEHVDGAVERLPVAAPAGELPDDRRQAFDALADAWADWLPSAYGVDGIEDEALRKWARRNRVEYIAAGSGRAVFGVPEGVLKLDFTPEDPNDNLREIRAWRDAPKSARKHLVPMLAFETSYTGRATGRWLLMERVEPGGQLAPGLRYELGRCGLVDLHPSNVSRDGRVLDYAFIENWYAWNNCQLDEVERLPKSDASKLAAAREAERAHEAAKAAEESWYRDSWQRFVAAVNAGDADARAIVARLEENHVPWLGELHSEGTLARQMEFRAASAWRLDAEDGAWERSQAIAADVARTREAMRAAREAAGFDPYTGESAAELRARRRKEARAGREALGDEGEYPDLLTERPNGCTRPDEDFESESHASAGTIVHTRCNHGRYGALHHLRYVAGGETVAALTLNVGPRGAATIDRVYTDPAHRRQGYARELLDYAKDQFRSVKHSKDLTGMGAAWKRGVERLSIGPIGAGLILADLLIPDPIPGIPGPITAAVLAGSAVESLPTVGDLRARKSKKPVDESRRRGGG